MEQSYLNDKDDVLVVVIVHYPKNRREEVDDLIQPPRRASSQQTHNDPRTYGVSQCWHGGPLDLLVTRRLLRKRRIGGYWGGCVSNWSLQGLSDIGLIRGIVQIKAEKLRSNLKYAAD